MRHKNLNSVLGLERWGGMLCGYFGIAISILTLIIEVTTGSIYFKMRKNMSSKMRTAFVYIVLICFYLNLLTFELAHSHMSFHKCWNLALALLVYNDILVYGQYKYLFSVYQY